MSPATVARGALLAAVLALAFDVRAVVELEPFDARTPAALRAAHAGKPFVLVFWSTACEPCREELPLWPSLQRRYPGVPIHLVHLSIDGSDPREEAGQLLAGLTASGLRTALVSDDVPERVFHAVDPEWRGELPAAWFFDSAHRSERRLGRVDAAWVESWMKARAREARSGHGR